MAVKKEVACYLLFRIFHQCFQLLHTRDLLLAVFPRHPGVLVAHSLDDFHHFHSDILRREHLHIVSVAADFLIEVVGGVQAVAEYCVAVLGAVVQYPLAAVQGSVLEIEIDFLPG